MNTFLTLDNSFPIMPYTDCTGFNDSDKTDNVTTLKLDALKFIYHHRNASLQQSVTIELASSSSEA